MSRVEKQVIVSLDPTDTLLLLGPLDFELSDGIAECFGATVPMNARVHVEGFKQLPILAVDKCAIRIILEREGSWKVVRGSTIPAGWGEAAKAVRRHRGTIVVVGDTDSGKSSLCTFIANRCITSNLNVGLIDADVGQADIGPPTTIGSARVSRQIFSLQELPEETSFFLGDTTPSSVPDKLIRLLIKLRKRSFRETDVVLINTDGWVQDPAAVRFKEKLVHETRPDLVVGLDKAREIEPLLSIIQTTSMKISSSSYASTRSKEQRKDAREAGYRRFLAGSRPVKIRREDTDVRMFDQPEQLILEWTKKFRGLIAGLLDEDERLLGLGRIIEVTEGYALVETNARETPRFLELGNVLLSSSYQETGYWSLH